MCNVAPWSSSRKKRHWHTLIILCYSYGWSLLGKYVSNWVGVVVPSCLWEAMVTIKWIFKWRSVVVYQAMQPFQEWAGNPMPLWMSRKANISQRAPSQYAFLWCWGFSRRFLFPKVVVGFKSGHCWFPISELRWESSLGSLNNSAMLLTPLVVNTNINIFFLFISFQLFPLSTPMTGSICNMQA